MAKMLYEVIEKLQRLNKEKQVYTIGQLRDAIQEQADELQKIADGLIV
jgi:hypothetical protein